MNAIVKAHSAGLFSLINNVMTCMEQYEHVQVDWSNGTMYSPPGVNLWDELFRPRGPVAEPFKVLEVNEDYWLTGLDAGKLYQGSDEWRWRLAPVWNKLCPRPEIVDASRDFPLPKRVVAALVRAHAHYAEQLTARSQTFDEYAAAIEREIGDGTLYLACGDNETLNWFMDRFPVLCHPETRRVATRDIDMHKAFPQTVADARICLEEVLIMSRADVFVSGISNMATAALYMNPRLKHVFLL